MQRYDLNQIAPSPWKNGGGSTREIACWPQGAGMDSFGWRVSVATLASSGAFSVFAGVDRQLLLLQGQGVRLHSSDGRVDHTLHRPWEPVAFAGDVPVHCTLTAGAAEDFNLMLRRGQWRGSLQVLRTACAPGRTGAGLCMVLAGKWQHGAQRLAPGQGLWWSAPTDAAPLCPVPDTGAALAWAGVETENLNEIGL